MKKLTIVSTAFAALVATGCAATGEKATVADLNQTLVGNTVERVLHFGSVTVTAWNYFSPDGMVYVLNDRKETGKAKYTFKDGEICLEWLEQGHDWNLSDSCSPAYKPKDGKVPGGKLLKGNVKSL